MAVAARLLRLRLISGEIYDREMSQRRRCDPSSNALQKKAALRSRAAPPLGENRNYATVTTGLRRLNHSKAASPIKSIKMALGSGV